MSRVSIQPELLCAWHGEAVLVVNTRGECGDDQTLSGFYFREARFLRTLRVLVEGEEPWLCEAAAEDPMTLRFAYVYPELTKFGGGGSGQSTDEQSTDGHGIAHRSIDILVTHRVGAASLDTYVEITNRGSHEVSMTVTLALDADFADIAEALEGRREQVAPVSVSGAAGEVCFSHDHHDLPYRTRVTVDGPGAWNASDRGLSPTLRLPRSESARLVVRVRPNDYKDPLTAEELERREVHLRQWRERLRA
jgi:hypothetical protein